MSDPNMKFIPWFMTEFLPPVLPWVFVVAVLVSACIWSTAIISIMRGVKRRRAERRAN